MTAQKLTFLQLLDLIEMEVHRGIISKKSFVAHIKRGVMPKVIKDVRGAVRLTVEREEDGFAVVQYPTKHANKTLCEVY